MFVKSKMTTNPFTVSIDSSITQAHDIMSKNNIKKLPVLKDGKLVGVVSMQDVAHASPSNATSLSMNELAYLIAKLKVKDIMTPNPITIQQTALIEEAAILMRSNKVSFLPVMDKDQLVGVITESDLVDELISLLGFNAPGTRLTIEVDDAPGIISNIGKIFSNYNTNINNIAVYRGGNNKTDVVLGVNTLNTEDIEKELADSGYVVTYKLQNK